MKTARECILETFALSGLTEAELARRMHCGRSTVNYLMSGERRWNEDWIDRFCEALAISPADIFCRSEDLERRVLRDAEEDRIHRAVNEVIRHGGTWKFVLESGIEMALKGMREEKASKKAG